MQYTMTAVARRVCLFFLFPVVFSACGGSSLPDGFAPAYGTVTLDGKPLVNAQVEFETAKGISYGRTDRSGNYTAEYSRSLTGAGLGTAKVRIRTNIVFPDEEVTETKDGEPFRKEILPEKYHTKTELTAEVTEKGAPYNFDLSS